MFVSIQILCNSFCPLNQHEVGKSNVGAVCTLVVVALGGVQMLKLVVFCITPKFLLSLVQHILQEGAIIMMPVAFNIFLPDCSECGRKRR